jgi:RNA polymerase sigma factor (sigma-70 family)
MTSKENRIEVIKLFDTLDYEKLSKVLGTLSRREENIIVMRFLEREKIVNIAAKFDLTSSRIYQIERKAIRKLLHPSRRKMCNAIPPKI